MGRGPESRSNEPLTGDSTRRIREWIGYIDSTGGNGSPSVRESSFFGGRTGTVGLGGSRLGKMRLLKLLRGRVIDTRSSGNGVRVFLGDRYRC